MGEIVKEIHFGPHRLLLGDCEEVLPLIGRVSAVVTDPPYGIGEDKGKIRIPRNRTSHKAFEKGKWDRARPTKEIFDAIREMSDHQIFWGGNHFADLLPASSGWLYWRKKMGGNFSDGELAWTSRRKALREFTYCNKRGGRVHPAQKPLPLMEWCLDQLGSVETVLDPYMGSGTTGIACLERGIAFIGVEKHEPYFSMACERFSEAWHGRQRSIVHSDFTIEWPIGCVKRSSCARHKSCLYGGSCPHVDRSIAAEVATASLQPLQDRDGEVKCG